MVSPDGLGKLQRENDPGSGSFRELELKSEETLKLIRELIWGNHLLRISLTSPSLPSHQKTQREKRIFALLHIYFLPVLSDKYPRRWAPLSLPCSRSCQHAPLLVGIPT